MEAQSAADLSVGLGVAVARQCAARGVTADSDSTVCERDQLLLHRQVQTVQQREPCFSNRRQREVRVCKQLDCRHAAQPCTQSVDSRALDAECCDNGWSVQLGPERYQSVSQPAS